MLPGKRRFLVPEVVQSSAMDCGPAALKSYLEGHGISLSYGRLREACQTEVDGTSIETLEELASGLGAPVEQVLLPKDCVFLKEARALPCIAVFRLPNGNTHFAVIWNVTAGIVQVMDPAHGRRWLSRERLLEELYEHEMTVPASDFRDWASSEEGLALLDATERVWSVTPPVDGEISIRGAVLLRPAKESAAAPEISLSPAIAAARDESRIRPLAELWQWLRKDGILEPGLLLMTTALSATAVVMEGLFFRAFLEAPALLTPLIVF
ncbi:MAG: cysteine peptidase family C39 domain-containing protein, partial [Vicinamibacteria bacterium]